MERGEIHHVDLEPTRGREQAGSRFVLVVSAELFNRLGTPLVCPITTGGRFARSRGWAVPIEAEGLRTRGFVLCNQVKTLDLQARGSRLIEKAPSGVVEDVLDRLAVLLA